MATRVDGSSGEGLQGGVTTSLLAASTKPALGTKPRLTPKPFSTQRNVIRSIHAPKTVTPASKNVGPLAESPTGPKPNLNTFSKPIDTGNSTAKTADKSESRVIGKFEDTKVLKPMSETLTQHSSQQNTTSDSKLISVDAHTQEQTKTIKEEKNHLEKQHSSDPRYTPNNSNNNNSSSASQTAEPKSNHPDLLKPTVTAKPVNTQITIPSILCPAEQKGEERGNETHKSVSSPLGPKPQDSQRKTNSIASPSANETSRGGISRNRLSMELTSKFQSSGLSLTPQPRTTPTINTRDGENKPTPSERRHTTPAQPNRIGEGELTDGGKEDMSGGSSIKRRISLLLDSSSRPEVIMKREEPQILSPSNGTGGVRQRIKSWTDPSESPRAENKPLSLPRGSFKSSKSEPLVEDVTESDLSAVDTTPKNVPFEVPQRESLSTQAADPPPEVSSARQPAERPLEISEDAAAANEQLERSTISAESSQPSESTNLLADSSPHVVQPAADNLIGDSSAVNESVQPASPPKVRRRSVRFGVVERFDGGPPEVLGSESDSSAGEEELSEDEPESEEPVSVPVYNRGGLQRNNDTIKKKAEEKQKCPNEADKEKLNVEDETKREQEDREQEVQLEAALQKYSDDESERARQEEKRLEEEEKQREEEREREILMEGERERVRQKEERLKEEDIQREKEKQREILEENLRKELREREEERVQEEEKERDRLKEKEKEREILREEERERERQLEIRWQRQREEEIEMARQKEERLKEEERQREEREEREERERERLRGEERLREDRERERLREEETERERLREEENEKERKREEERERERLREEREKERLREEERVRERQREEEKLRVEREEQENEKERQLQCKKEEMERERLRQIESLRLMEEEKVKEQERERQTQEEMERKKAKELEERLREAVRQSEEEESKLLDEETNRWKEGERQEDVKERLTIESEDRQTEETEEEQKEEKREAESLREGEDQDRGREDKRPADSKEKEDKGETVACEAQMTNLISFDSEDVLPKSESLSRKEGTESKINMYGDFSVGKPLPEIRFDDFSVKPRRWGSKPKSDTSQTQVEVVHPEVEAVDVLVSLDVNPQKDEAPESEQLETSDSPKPSPDPQRPGEMETEEEVSKKREGEDYKQEEQIKGYCTGGDGSDTDALINSEPGDQQYGSCEQTSPAMDSPKPICDQEPEMSPDDPDTGILDTETELPALPESTTPLLDNQVQRSRAQLGKRRSQRTRLPTSVRNSPAALPTHTESATPTNPDWRTCDSTDGEVVSKRRASESEEEQPRLKEVVSPPPTSQRVPIFPGMNPSALMAQLKKRTGGGTEESPEKGVEEESPGEELAPPTSQLSRSPRSPALLAGAARVLPPIGGTDGGTNSAPSWLKELKSKKRLSQCDSEA